MSLQIWVQDFVGQWFAVPQTPTGHVPTDLGSRFRGAMVRRAPNPTENFMHFSKLLNLHS